MAQGFDKLVPNTEKKFVKFRRGCSPYAAGEVALFPYVPSLKLTGGPDPIGYYVKRDEDGKWVPDTGDEDVNLEQTNENGSGEQVATGAGSTDGEGAAAKPAAAKKAGQSRRQRAKL